MMAKFIRAISAEFLQHRRFYLVILSLALLMMLTLPATMQGADGKEYLRWTHSLLYDQDLHLLNNLESVGGGYKLTPTGYTFERVNIGAPVMWLPFYGAASLFLARPAEDELYPAASLPQLIWLNFSSWLYPILGGILTVVALRRFFSPRAVAGAMAALLFGTPLLFYMMTFPMSAHPALVFLSALLLFLWLSPRAISHSTESPPAATVRPGWLHYMTLGLVCGWLMLVATYNVIFFLLPGFDLLKQLISDRNWRRTLQNGLAVSLGGLIGFGPQLIVWWALFGNPLYSPYSGQLFWTEPYLRETLFSTFHGLFFFAPVLLLVIPGLWVWRRQDGWAAASLALAWAALAYIVSINVAWWAGASFGNRYFLSLTPFFALGLAAFLDHGKKWAALLVGLCVLWAVGLYLQFLNGVWFTSDSIVYPALELAGGQLTIWANTFSVLPHLLANRPWHLVPTALLPILLVATVVISRLLYGWVMLNRPNHRARVAGQMSIVGLGLAIVLFTGLSALRGNQARAALAEAGFYDRPYQPVLREIKEVAGKAGLVTRALYHRQTGQPEKAIADLSLASTLWKSDGAESASRLYLGPKERLPQPAPQPLHLDYPGNVRLIGYHLLDVTPQSISGELYWEKVAGPKSDMAVTPIVRAFDQAGDLAGRATVDFPFPAEYIPPGDIFKDTFRLDLAAGSNGWIWLQVTLAEDYALPLSDQGESDSGVVATLHPGRFPEEPFISNEDSPAIALKPFLLNGRHYRPGQMIPLQLSHQAAGETGEPVPLALSLIAGNGDVVAQEEMRLRATGRPVASTYCFPVPTTAPPGDFQLELELLPASAGTLLDQADRPARKISLPIQLSTNEPGLSPEGSICRHLEADFPRRYEPTAPQNPRAAPVTGDIELAGYDLAIIPQPASVLARVVLHWHIQANVSRNYLVRLQLLDSAGQAVIDHTAVPVHETRPSSTWLKGEWLLDEHLLDIPPLPPGSYTLALALVDEQTGQAVAQPSGQDRLILEEVRVP